MEKIFNFKDGVAYPRRGAYSSRRGKYLLFVHDTFAGANQWVLKKECPVNTYRYPAVTFDASKFNCEQVDDYVRNLGKYIALKKD